jgi:hypothetical protein
MIAIEMRLCTYLTSACCAILVVLDTGAALGQLTVLSKGNPTAEWRKAQLAQIETQLADKAIKAELKLELVAQQEWLTGYSTDKLRPQPPKSTEKSDEPLEDPVLDPDKQADPIRKQLLGPNAKPTSANTEKLRAALEKSPNDVGLRQLQLHWLDQPQYREEYPAEIADAASRLCALLETNQKIDPAAKKAAIAMTLYRQARALGYRLDLDLEKKKPLEKEVREKVDSQLVGAYTQIISLVGPGHPEFVLIEIRMLRRDNWFGRALQLLERNASTIEPRWYLEKRRDLLRGLGWKAPAAQAQEVFAAAFPEEAKASPR